MSHFTTVKTNIVDRECLKKAIKELGYNYEDKKFAIKGHAEATADLAIKSENGCYIGFKWNGKSYDIVADWGFIGSNIGINRYDFTSQIKQKYAYLKTKDVLIEQGLILAVEEVNDKNEIVLTVRQW
jgi:hypothetical protein